MSSRNVSSPQFGSKKYFSKVFRGVHPPAMFATPEEILRTHTLGDMGSPVSQEDSQGNEYHEYFDSPEELLHYKLQDDEDLADDIREKGFDWSQHLKNHFNRVQVTDRELSDGHHRLAAMLAHRPDEFMPIETWSPKEKYLGGK